MRAVQIDRHGGPEVLTLRELPVPEPGEGMALVRIHHAGVNVMDVATRVGRYEHSRTC